MKHNLRLNEFNNKQAYRCKWFEIWSYRYSEWNYEDKYKHSNVVTDYIKAFLIVFNRTTNEKQIINIL